MQSPKKYVSAFEYSKLTGLGQEEVKRQCRAGNIPCLMTDGGYYKIPIYDDDVVPIEQYKEMEKRAITAETTIELMKNMLLERSTKDEK